MIDGYISIKEASNKWGISQRRIQVLCTEGRIDGASRLGREWAIPSDAPKPADKRVKTGNYLNWRKRTSSNMGKEFSMSVFGDFKASCDDLDIEFEVAPIVDIQNIKDDREKRIVEGTASVNDRLTVIQENISKLNCDIDRLTNQADGIDYAIAVISGVVTGIIDATVVGEWDFATAKKDTYKEVNNKVIEFAKKQPDYQAYCEYALEGKGGHRRIVKDPDRLDTAINYLEWRFHLPGDGAYRTGNFGIDGNTHRIDDFCHHPTLVGLVCCVIVQFSGHTMYVNKLGEDINIPITINEYGNFVGTNAVTKLFAGVINWFITCAKTIANRKGHFMSDIATTASLPGSFLSTIAELASIPCFRSEDFLLKLRQAYKNGIGNGKGQINLGAFNKLFEGAQNKLDVTTEMAVLHELKRQALPTVINEVLVRASYFIRRFIGELKFKNDVSLVEWKRVIPFNNRTIVRMMTIASGTFTTIDIADAAVHAASKSVDTATFFSNMILRVNFVGIGRLAIAIGTDTGMAVARGIKRSARIKLQEEQLFLLNAKVYYKQAGMWIAADTAGETIESAYNMMENATLAVVRAREDIKGSLDHIEELLPAAEEKNPGLSKEMADILKWG